MAVHAHPDDESLSTGGLLAASAADGRAVCVVTCTRGERGEVIALPGTTSEGRAGLEGDGPALGAYRETELAAALTALGNGRSRVEHAFLDRLPGPEPTRRPERYEDSGMTWVAPGVAGPAPDSPPTAFARVPLDEPARRLAVLLRHRRPAVVATYEPGGGYRHPDHVRTHAVAVRALELAADPAWHTGDEGPSAEPWSGAELWQAVAPAAVVRAARATLAGLPGARALADAHGLTFPDPDEDLPPFAVENLDPGEVVEVDVRPVLDRVVAALRAHATQVQHATALPRPVGEVAGWYALSNDVLAPILATETYRVSGPAGRRARSPWR